MKNKKKGFGEPIFSTDYSFQSPRALIRIVSDAFSRQHCDYTHAKVYASLMTEGKCLYCGKPQYDLKKYKKTKVVEYHNLIHYDHVYPAILLNLFEVGNVALSCGSCNLDKSSRLPMDYYDVRAALGLPLFISDRNEFEAFLDDFVSPYKEKWPRQFEVHKLDLTDEEFKERMTEMLSQIDISSMTSRYSPESSINSEFWERVVAQGELHYAKLTARDIEHRIGYANEFFESKFGPIRKVEDCKVSELTEFSNELLSSKSGSKGEISKFRMLIRMVIEVLNEEMMDGQLEGFYEAVPTYGKLQ